MLALHCPWCFVLLMLTHIMNEYKFWHFYQVHFALVQLQGLLGSVSLQPQQQRTTQHMPQHSMEQPLVHLEPMTQPSTLLHMQRVSQFIQPTPLRHLVPQPQGTLVGAMITQVMERAEISDIQVCREFRVRKFWTHNDGKRMVQFLYYNIMFDNWSGISIRNFWEWSQDKWHTDLTILMHGLRWRSEELI